MQQLATWLGPEKKLSNQLERKKLSLPEDSRRGSNWTKQAIDEYADSATLAQGMVFCRMNKSGRITGKQMSEQALYNVVLRYATLLDLGIAPHDLLRTFAKLAHKGGSGLDQIQLSLGHNSIQTTETYLGLEQDLSDAPCDHLGLRL